MERQIEGTEEWKKEKRSTEKLIEKVKVHGEKRWDIKHLNRKPNSTNLHRIERVSNVILSGGTVSLRLALV